MLPRKLIPITWNGRVFESIPLWNTLYPLLKLAVHFIKVANIIWQVNNPHIRKPDWEKMIKNFINEKVEYNIIWISLLY